MEETKPSQHTSRGKAICKKYSLDDMYEISPIPHLNLEGIKELHCYTPYDGTKYRLFVCEVSGRYKGGCPNCGSIYYQGNGTTSKDRIIHDDNSGLIQIDIQLPIPRYICQDCGKSFTYPLECISPQHAMTKRLYDLICKEAFEQEFSTVAKKHGISDSTVENIFDEYSSVLEEKRLKNGVQAGYFCGIDEKHIQNHPRGIITNLETGELLEMTENNRSATMRKAIESLVGYENIKVVTIDMSNGYKGMLETVIPNATIVIDKYHVINDMSVKVRLIRKRLLGILKENERYGTNRFKLLRDVSMDNYLFRYSEEELLKRPEKAILMAELCKAFPEFNTLHKVKVAFENIYCQDNREDAEKAYNLWLKSIDGINKELFKELFTLRKSMNYWHDYFLNYFNPGCRFTVSVKRDSV